MKNFLFWTIAVMITIAAAIYQRTTGPTYPYRTRATIDGTEYSFALKRSQTNTHPCMIKLEVPGEVTGEIFYRRLKMNEEWTAVEMKHDGEHLAGELPSQPAAGKLEYYIVLNAASGNETTVMKEKPVVIRFKGNVPAVIMLPHILIMFFAMLLSNLAGLTAAFGRSEQRRYGRWALWLLLAGGMVLGPLVQKYAFGDLWTGIPFGWDLTDNKTLIAVVVWIFAVFMNRKKARPGYTIAAAVILLLIYSIPHSLFGSELDFATGTVTQG
ncbi:MAG: hypothetical protein RB288_10840 [Bacteroidales bacterium]|jgi:hypothetical protein|nr:hypothetical protein [Bacteroidales bacterium]